MKPTKEQQTIVTEAPKVTKVVINAVAGSGKTHTNVLLAKVIKEPGIYLAFNKAMVTDAEKKFPSHVLCKTMHSLAFAAKGRQFAHKLSRPTTGYVNVAGTGAEIARYFRISDLTIDEKTYRASHIGLSAKQVLTKFESSKDKKIISQHLPWDIRKLKERKLELVILKWAEQLWVERIDVNSKVLITHDTYLKLYQLSRPKLNWGMIYVDEFQDVTPCFAEILSYQSHAKVIMTGDSRQQIYAWRGAINALQDAAGTKFSLTKSFRYGQAIADIATCILGGKVIVKGFEKIHSVAGGKGVIDHSKPYTMLFRTNSRLIGEAISLLDQGKRIKIVANITDIIRRLESMSALKKGELKKVKHEDIIPFSEWEDLMIESEDDPSLKMLANFVLQGRVDYIINTLKNYKASSKPEVTLVTAHKSKGLEWDQVKLAEDFPSCFNEELYVGLPEPEENLLYVACTRAKHVLQYNSTVTEILIESNKLKAAC